MGFGQKEDVTKSTPAYAQQSSYTKKEETEKHQFGYADMADKEGDED